MLERIEADIDWISMTMPANVPHWADWNEVAVKAVNLVADAGNIVKTGSLYGYEGTWAGGAFYGDRSDGSILRLSGAWAGRLFRETYSEYAHYSRIDVQVTVKTEVYDGTIGETHRIEAETAALAIPGNRKRKVHTYTDNEGGYTLYIGSRLSSAYAAIYNKDREADDEYYRNCWRYEVRYVNEASTTLASRLYGAEKRIPEVVAATVRNWLQNRGVQGRWGANDDDNASPTAVAPKTDIARSLAWLEAQVRPTTSRLIAMGYAESVYTALGLGAEGLT